MLKYADQSLILSPCNIEMDLDDYLYYTNGGMDENTELFLVFFFKKKHHISINGGECS